MSITLFTARELVTLDEDGERANAVAVLDGRILYVGTTESVTARLGDAQFTLDTRFADAVLVPGFIEAHGHLLPNGSFSQHLWLGFDDRLRADGTVDRGCTSIDEVITRLREVAATTPVGEHIFGVGFDPTFLDGRALTRHDLDRVSTEHYVSVMNASLHWGYANSLLINEQGITAATDALGVVKDADGEPNGQFAETAMALIFDAVGAMRQETKSSLNAGAQLARLAGVTTHSDLAVRILGRVFDEYSAYAASGELPVRVVISPHMYETFRRLSPAESLELVQSVRGRCNDRLLLGPLKWISDGSIQGFTAALNWPGYCNGSENGHLLLDRAAITQSVLPFHRAGFQVAIHANGDRAIDETLLALRDVVESDPRDDHRHRIEHAQMMSPQQLDTAAELGVALNFFSNHLFYWGDIHYTTTMGPERAMRSNPAKSALVKGIKISIHSDAPVTPVAPLFTMWCAVNRVTRTGRVLGEQERLTPLEALRAVTLGAAELMHLDHELGSIEVGKLADFTALAQNPLTTDPMAIKNIPVVGTVLAGVPT
ncbi:MAG: amidohydrolase [Actinomycetes bacterium]